MLAVKENQPKLYQAIQAFFTEHLDDDLQRVPHRRHETCETGHGRTDERYYYLAKLPRDFPLRKAWPSIKAIGMVVRITEKSDGTTSDDVRTSSSVATSAARVSPRLFAAIGASRIHCIGCST